MTPSRGPRVFHFCAEARVSAKELLACVEGEVPDLRTERAKKPMSPASDPSTRSGLLWTGNNAGGVRRWEHPALGQPHDTTHGHVDHARDQRVALGPGEFRIVDQ